MLYKLIFVPVGNAVVTAFISKIFALMSNVPLNAVEVPPLATMEAVMVLFADDDLKSIVDESVAGVISRDVNPLPDLVN